jgi:nucleoside-diphosphate-sugar epimerase
MKMKVTVLGHNGHIGNALVRAFADAGHEVTGFGRSDKHPDPRVKFVKGDAESVGDLRAAVAGADVVVNALNLRYDQWDRGRMEGQVARVVEAMGTSGKTLMFPGNIYNYAAKDGPIGPNASQEPATPRGAIRVRSEALIEAAAGRGDFKAIIIRAGDFFGPDCTGDWFEQVILREAGKGRMAPMGRPGTGHAWAYLPDLARAFVKVAEVRETLGAFERFHFGGYFVTPEEMTAAVTAAAPIPLKVTSVPWFALHIIGLTNGVIREVLKMRYLWETAMSLRDDRLDLLLGPDFMTPFGDAVAAATARYFPRMEAAA